MKISVDYKSAEEMSMMFAALIGGEKFNRENLRALLGDNYGYNMFFKFYSKENFKEEYLDMLESLYKREAYVTENTILQRMYLAYKNVFSNPHILYKKLEVVKGVDFYSLEDKLKSRLPKNNELNMDIYFVLDGNNGGSIVDEHTMCLDVLFWPTKKELSEQMEGVILHEFHHIGAIYWRERDVKRIDLITKENGIGTAINLVESIMGEGSAFYFFNGDLNMYEICLEEYGEDFAKDFKNTYCESWKDLEVKIKELEDLLIKLLEDTSEDYSKLKNKASQYSYSIENMEALDKVIGNYMCQTIDKAFGSEKILDSIKHLKNFLIIYNHACDKLNTGYKFSQELIALWNRVWES